MISPYHSTPSLISELSTDRPCSLGGSLGGDYGLLRSKKNATLSCVWGARGRPGWGGEGSGGFRLRGRISPRWVALGELEAERPKLRADADAAGEGRARTRRARSLEEGVGPEGEAYLLWDPLTRCEPQRPRRGSKPAQGTVSSGPY